MDEIINATTADIYAFLRGKLQDGAKFVSYAEIAKKVQKTRHTVKYHVEKLKQLDLIRERDGKLELVD